MPSLSKTLKLIVICLIGIAAIIGAGGAYNYYTITKHPKVLDPLNNELYRLYTEEGYKVSKVDLTLASFIKLQYQLTIQALRTGKSAHISLSYGISGSNNISKETALKIENKDPKYAMARAQVCSQGPIPPTQIDTYLLNMKLEKIDSISNLKFLPKKPHSTATIGLVPPEKALTITSTNSWMTPPLLTVLKDSELNKLSSALSLVAYPKTAPLNCSGPENDITVETAISVIKRVTNLNSVTATKIKTHFIEKNRKYITVLTDAPEDWLVTYVVVEIFENQHEMYKRLSTMLRLADKNYSAIKRTSFVFNYEKDLVSEATSSTYFVSAKSGFASEVNIASMVVTGTKTRYLIETKVSEYRPVVNAPKLSDLIANSAKE